MQLLQWDGSGSRTGAGGGGGGCGFSGIFPISCIRLRR